MTRTHSPEKLVVGNWKMNGSLATNAGLVRSLVNAVADGVAVGLCVPFPYLHQVGELLDGSTIELGAQDVSAFSGGAYTGQVSASMLLEFGCRLVIVGHSERRAMLHESDAEVAEKARAALSGGLTPIVCVGESLEERASGRVREVLERQLDALDRTLDAAELAIIVIAYEPVWAIGSGQSATPEQVQEALGFIRAWLKARTARFRETRVLYGGSVKGDSAAGLFALPDADGGLIGGASLVAEEFIEICRAAALASRNDLIKE